MRGIKPDDLASLKEKLNQEVCELSAPSLASISYSYNFQLSAAIEVHCFFKLDSSGSAKLLLSVSFSQRTIAVVNF
jgi:hypothetical protein